MFILNGKPLALDVAFTAPDGTQYPANWLRLSTAEQKAAIGITEAPDAPQHDQRYYWGYDADGNLIPKQLEDEEVTVWEDIVVETDGVSGIASTSRTYTQTGLKTQHILQIKETANSLLQPTDWYLIRKVDEDIAVPVGITSFRKDVRVVCNENEVKISLTTTTDELRSLVVGISTIASERLTPWPNLNDYQ